MGLVVANLHRVNRHSFLGKSYLDGDMDKTNQLLKQRKIDCYTQGSQRGRGLAQLGLEKDSDEERLGT